MTYWEPSTEDVEWAELQADNWIYSQGFAKSLDFTAEDYQKERQAVTTIVLFVLQELGTHIAPITA